MRTYNIRKRVLVTGGGPRMRPNDGRVVSKVVAMTGSKSQLVFGPLTQDEPMQRRPDISLAGRKLAWKPTIPVEEGLKKTISYFQKLAA